MGYYLFQLDEFWDKCFLVDKESSTLIDDDFELTNLDSYTGQRTSVSLRVYKLDNWYKKKKRWKKIYIFFLLMFYFLAYKKLKNGFWKSHQVKTVVL